MSHKRILADIYMCVYLCDPLYLSICVSVYVWLGLTFNRLTLNPPFCNPFCTLCMCMSLYTCRELCACVLGTKTSPVCNAHFARFIIFQLEQLFHIQSFLVRNWATSKHCKPDRRLLSRAWRTDWMWAWREWLMCDFKQDQALEKDEGWFGHSRVPGVWSI